MTTNQTYLQSVIRSISLEALNCLRSNLKPNSLNWLDTEDRELNEIIQNLELENCEALSESEALGFWKEVLAGMSK